MNPPITNTVLDAAAEYIRRGWPIVPVPLGTKAPQFQNWPALRLGEDDLVKYFRGEENVGVILGSPSGNLIDVDLDVQAAIFAAEFFLPQTGFIFGRKSKPRSHYFLTSDTRLKPQKFCGLDGKTLIELRSDGQQTLVPPSVHPTGEIYEFSSSDKPTQVPGTNLHRAVTQIAAASLIAQHWPEQGRRNDAANALAGMLLRSGWSEEDVSKFVLAVTIAAGDEESKQRVRDVVSTARRLATGCTATGTPTLAQIIGNEVLQRVRQWLALGDTAASHDRWPEPAPLGDELLPVPQFDLDFLPLSLRPLVEDISERMQAPADYAAAATIVALAGCVNRRAVIVPKKHDISWCVVPNLWGAIIAPPGMMKSPILRAVTLPLTGIEDQWRAEFESARSEFGLEKEMAELRWQSWREEFKRATKKGEAPPIQPDNTSQEPMQQRLVLSDATFEKLHAILAQNPAGVLVIRDELTGWLSELGRLGREGERAFFLQAWNGDSGFTVDRIGRGSIYVPAVCVSLLGAIQPARLRSYLSEMIEGGPGDDGLFQRFQIMVWPDLASSWRLVDRLPSEAALMAAERIFKALANIEPDDPVRLHFSPDAQALFFEWLAELERRIRGDSGLAPVFVAHLAKYRSLLPSLAGLFELADGALQSHPPKEILISLENTKRAAALCDYLEFHAKRIYGSVISPETRSARELARHIQASDLPSPFTTRAAYLKGWSGLDTPERIRGALALLEEAGWVCRDETSPTLAGGRPSEVWFINPKVSKHHA